MALALGFGAVAIGNTSVEARGTIYNETLGDDISVEASASAYPNLVGHAFGIYIQQDQHTVVGKNLTIVVSGEGADGLRSNPSGSSNWQQAKGSITVGDNLNITISGTSGDGVNANGSTKIKIGDNATIATLYNGALNYSNGDASDGSHAIRANFHAEIEIGDGLTASTLGEGSYAVFSAQGRSTTAATDGSKILIGERATLSTVGKNSHAVAMISENGRVTIGDQANLSTQGEGAHAIAIYSDATDKGYGKGAQAKIGNQSEISTSGKAAYGAYASTENSIITLGENNIVKTSGENSHGLYTTKGKIEVGDGLDLKTSGIGAHGAYATSTTGVVEFQGGASVMVSGATDKATYVAGANSQALYANAGSISGIAAGSKFTLVGDMKAENAGTINLAMDTDSEFTGIADQTTTGTINLTMDNGGHLYFFDNNPSNFMRIEADGAITINGGTIHFDTNIVNEQADYLVVKQGIQGTGGYIGVTNQGGAATTGSEIVPLMDDVLPSSSPAQFELTNLVELGGYNYILDQRDDGAGGNEWYLKAVKSTTEEKPVITNPADAGVNIFSGAYLLNYAEMNTLLQRMGDLRQGESKGNIWARTYGGKFDSNSNSFLRGFDMNYWGLQVGADKKFSRKDQKGDWYVGGMFGYSKGDLDYGYGNGSIDSKSIGAYGTYIAKNGFYSDLVLKYNWMKNDFKVLDSAGDRVTGKDINTDGFAASLEVGRRYHFEKENKGKEVKEGWYVEPQAQLVMGHYSGDSFRASNGLKVDVDSYDSILGRIGLNIGKEIKSGKNPVNAYAKVSYVHEFDGDVNYYLNSSKEDASFGDSWWVYGVGITAQINKKHNLYLDIERASGGRFTQSWAVNGGYRFTW